MARPQHHESNRAPEKVGLPEGWVYASLQDLTVHVLNTKPEDEPARLFRYVDISSISSATHRVTGCKSFKGAEAPSRARRPIKVGDVLFSNVRTYLRNVALVTDDLRADLCSTGFTVLRPNQAVVPHFLLYSVLSDSFIDEVTELQTGTHYPAVSDRAVLSQAIPLPPLVEQKRIAAKVEALLAGVDAARERLSRVPAILKRFRQSVLAAACSGRLTADWREMNPDAGSADELVRELRVRRESEARSPAARQHVKQIYESPEENDSSDLPESWRFVSLNKLCASFDYGTSAKSQASGIVPVLRMGNLQNGAIDWQDLAFTSDAKEIQRYSLAPNTVLFNRTNSPELVGKTAIYRGERPAIFAGYLIRIVNFPQLSAEYLNGCLNTGYARDFCSREKTDGVSQSNINARKLGTFEVPLCPLAEQREIVRRVEVLFKLADAIEKRVAMATARAEKLTQSILAKAFRGELVPAEAELARREGRSFEPASALLARTQADATRETSFRSEPRGRAPATLRP